MRRRALLLVVLLAACDATSGAGDTAPDSVAGTVARSRSGSTPPPPSGPDAAAAPGSANAGDATDGTAALRQLAAAGRTILIEGEGDFSPGEFVVDSAGSPSAYAGAYDFGDSEWESTLTLTVQGETVSGSRSHGSWGEGANEWISKETRLEGGRVVGGRLTAPGWEGIFVRFQGRSGLILLREPDDAIHNEFGYTQEGGQS